MPKKNSLVPSQIALAAVILVVGGSFVWWARNRPSHLLYQAHSKMGLENQSAVIAEYARLLKRKDIPADEEIKLRKAVGGFYMRAIRETASGSLYYVDDYSAEVPALSAGERRFLATRRAGVVGQGPDHPFVALAKKEFDRVLELNPKDAEAHYDLGVIFWMGKQEKYAMDEFSLAQQNDPRLPQPLYFLSLINQSRGNAQAGKELALQALAIDPTYDEARAALVSAESALGDDAAALDEYEKLSTEFRSNPENRALHALHLSKQNYWTEAMREIDAARGADPRSGTVHLVRGQMLLDEGRTDEASGEFAQAAALLQYNVWPVVYQCRVASLQGLCGDASAHSQVLAESFPRWAWAHLTVCWTQVCRGDDIAALSSLDEALRLSPKFYDALDEKVRILSDRRQYDELGKILRPLLDEKVHEAEAYATLSESLFHQGKYGLAEEMALSAIKINPRFVWSYVWLGLSRAHRKDSDGARRALERALSLNDRPEVAAYGGLLEGLLGRADVAEKMIREQLNKAPRSALVWTLLGDVQRMRRDDQDAVQSYLTAVSIKPYFLPAQLGLVSAYWNGGEREPAAQALACAARINPNNAEVRLWRSKLKKT